MKIFVVIDDERNVLAAYTDEQTAHQVADLLTESGDCGYDGHEPVTVELDTPRPAVDGKLQLRSVLINRQGHIAESKWLPPLVLRDGLLVEREKKTEFLGFTDPEYDVDARARLVILARGYDDASKRAKQIAAAIVSNGFWPECQRNESDIAAKINFICNETDT